jgi:RNA methyltransferase, TrmH family
MPHTITSLQNPLVKKIIRLQQKASERKLTALFVAEGRREVSLALAAGYVPEYVLLCEDLYQPDTLYPVAWESLPAEKVIAVSPGVYNKIAYRENAEGVFLVGRQKPLSAERLILSKNPLILVLESVEKPGNLGAVLRTADAAGADLVILADAAADIYNPNVIRASLGCVFRVPVMVSDTGSAIHWLKQQNVRILAAALQTDTLYDQVDMKGPVALVFGKEDTGLSAQWREAAELLIKIPMSGSIDSLNISVSAAVLCFEAIRQRRN